MANHRAEINASRGINKIITIYIERPVDNTYLTTINLSRHTTTLYIYHEQQAGRRNELLDPMAGPLRHRQRRHNHEGAENNIILDMIDFGCSSVYIFTVSR